MLVPKNLISAFDRITDYWSPKVVGRVNDQLLKVAKLKGELIWHAHDEEDELFYVVKGRLRIALEDRAIDPIELQQGDFFVVPKGVMHNPVADEECWILLIESASTKHTGNQVVPQTRSLTEQLA